MEKFQIRIFYSSKVDMLYIEAKNMCSALIIMSGKIATINKYKKVYRITIQQKTT